MIENKIPEYIWALLIKFYINSQPFLGEIRDLKRLSLCSCWMLLVMSFTVVVRMPGIYAINATTIVPPSLTSLGFQAVVIPTDIIASSMKGKRPISIPENEVITSEDTEDYLEEDSSENYSDLDSENSSAFGIMLGARCEFTCDKRLHHVFCSPVTNKCECEKNYPVKIGSRKGCAKPKKLGDQCFYDQTCLFSDENAICMQIDHNAICQCREGFHLVSHTKPMRRTFCTQDLSTIGSDLPTLLGVTTGIAVLAGLICMVLHLFSKTKYPRTRHFADAHHGPPIMFASDTGIPLTIQSNRPSSRSSQRSTGSLDSYNGRRSSGCKGILVSQSRQGSRRPSLASVHSTTSSIRSYSSRRFEQELRDKELRHEMKKQLCRLQEQQNLQKLRPQIIIGDSLPPFTVSKQIMPPTTSPHILTPNSTDELLPSVQENDEFSPEFIRRNP